MVRAAQGGAVVARAQSRRVRGACVARRRGGAGAARVRQRRGGAGVAAAERRTGAGAGAAVSRGGRKTVKLTRGARGRVKRKQNERARQP